MCCKAVDFTLVSFDLIMLADLFDEGDGEEGGSWDASYGKTPYFRPHKVPPITAMPPSERSDSGFVGLQNLGATCYLNSLLQTMYMSPEIRRGIFRLTAEEMGGNLTGILGSLRRLFVMLKCAEEQSVCPSMLTDAFGWDEGQTRVQQDAHEMQNLLMEQIDLQTAGSSVAGLIPRLFRARVRYRTECLGCGALNDRLAEEWSLMADVQVK